MTVNMTYTGKTKTAKLAGAAIALAAVMLLIAAPALFTPRTTANASNDAFTLACDYLRGRQQPDGGFAEPGGKSSDMLTCWAVTGLASMGIYPGVLNHNPLEYLAARAPGWQKLTDIERGCIAVASAGSDPRSFGGRNLVADIKSNIDGGGHIGNNISEHAWGVIALAAAGEPVPENCRGWLLSKQNIDGGFGYNEVSGSDPDDTGAAIQALIAAGEDNESGAIDRALSYLKFCQADDGGFCWKSATSNVGSTAWAVQGIAAAGCDPASAEWTKNGRTPVTFLLSRQQPDGHFKYMGDNDSQPAWMTAEALPAVLKRPLPLNYTPETRNATAGENTAPVSGEVDGSTAEDLPWDEGVFAPGTTDGAVTGSEGDSAPGSTATVTEGSRSSSSMNSGEEDPTGSDSGSGVLASAGDTASSGGGNSGLAWLVAICSCYLAVLGLTALGVRLWYRPRRAEPLSFPGPFPPPPPPTG